MLEASEQPARESGIRTVLSGFRSFEVSAMKCTPHGFHLGGFDRELQRVSADIGNTMENLRRLVIVRQDDRIALSFQFVDRLDVRRHERPLDRRDHFLDPLIKMRGGTLDLGGPFQRRHWERLRARDDVVTRWDVGVTGWLFKIIGAVDSSDRHVSFLSWPICSSRVYISFE